MNIIIGFNCLYIINETGLRVCKLHDWMAKSREQEGPLLGRSSIQDDPIQRQDRQPESWSILMNTFLGVLET